MSETEPEMTVEEARDMVIATAVESVRYWSTNNPRHLDGTPYTCAERISGAMFTFLAELDGSGGLPACDIVVIHTDDDGNQTGETRVSDMLHEYYAQARTK